MAEKMTCPACDSHSSSIWHAYTYGHDFPCCGLPVEAATAVMEARERGSDDALVRRTALAEVRAAAAEKGERRALAQLEALRAVLAREPSDFDAD